MTGEEIRHRLLLVAGEPSRGEWRDLIPASWDVGMTANIEHARLIQRVRACDAVLLSGDLPGLGQADALDRLFAKGSPPVVLVAEAANDAVLSTVRAGGLWLPTETARNQPDVLLAVVQQAMSRTAQPPQPACSGNCQARAERLLEMLWQATPGMIPGGPWYTQHHMLQRFDEEVARTQRDGGPLSVILGEMHPGSAQERTRTARTREWAVQQIAHHKRRCDVAGQYGLDGFMLVLPRATPEQARGECRRLHTVLSHPPQGLPPLHVAFGFAGVPGDRANVPGLLGQAELRLEDARQGCAI